MSVTACSSGKDKQAQAAMTPHDVTLTAAQQKSIELYQVAAADLSRAVGQPIKGIVK